MPSLVSIGSTRLLRPLTPLSLLAAFALSAAHAQDAGPLPEANDHVLDSPKTEHPQTPPPPQAPAPIERHDAPTPLTYDKTIFQTQLDPAQLAYFRGFDGAPASDLYHDKQFR